MNFLDSYKKIEKICNEIYGENHGLTSYIDDMITTPKGSLYILGWDEDLKKLKHYRWIRNRIVHDPGCTEESMCTTADVEWIDNFYLRIMSAKDPLSLYYKSENNQRIQRQKELYKTQESRFKKINVGKKNAGCFSYIICGLLIIISFSLMLML